MTATARLDLLDEFSERPVSKVDRSHHQTTETGCNGSSSDDHLPAMTGSSAT